MENKFKISPEEFKKILDGVELVSIILKESKTYYNSEIIFLNETGVNIKSSSEYKVSEDGFVNIYQTYELDARKEKSKSRYIQISATFQVTLKSKEKFSAEFFEVYQKSSLSLNTWPYLREFVNNMTRRMDAPPLTLPFYRV